MKILIIRLSSIGDIVLTTPIIRCLKQQLPSSEIHYLTKIQNRIILENNPNVDLLHTIEKSTDECLSSLKAEKFDVIIDLHKNIRSKKLIKKLGVVSYSFPKENILKFLLTKFKINKLTQRHVVERYFESVLSLNVKNDQLPCDYFIPAKDEINLAEYNLVSNQFLTFAIGAQYATKRLPQHKILELVNKIDKKIVLLGGKMDQEVSHFIVENSSNNSIIDTCGNLNLNQSADFVKKSTAIITHDTGLMHIASCFKTPIISIWGNTVLDFGMYPYHPLNKNYTVHEVAGLPCRPCSKIGYQKCPKGHFKCMENQDIEEIVKEAVELIK